MTQIVIDNKKYVLGPAKEYQTLQKKAALKTKAEIFLYGEEPLPSVRNSSANGQQKGTIKD